MKRLSATIIVLAVGAMGLAPAAMAFTKPYFTNSNRPFTSSLTSKVIMKNPAGQEVKCTTGTNEKGEVIAGGSKKAKKIVMKFTGCENTTSTKCTSTGAGVGEIVTQALEGELGYLEPGVALAKVVAFALKPEVGTLITLYTCLQHDEVKGCIISKLSEANILTNKFSLVFEEAGGEQKPKSFEPELTKKEPCSPKGKVGNEAELAEGWEFGDELNITAPLMQKIES
jgi:hypothetical protein